MVPIYDHGGIHVFIEYNCISVLLRGFYKSYRIGKNINGEDFPADHDGDDSIYGGQSIWGKIDAIASRYHWPLNYIIWGISWANLRLMMDDSLRVDYKSKSNTRKDTHTIEVIDTNDIESLRNSLKDFGL